MAYKGTLQPVINLCFQLVIGLCQAIVIAVKKPAAPFCKNLRCIIHRKQFSGRALRKMRGADHELHLFKKTRLFFSLRLIENIKFHAPQNIHFSAEELLHPADLCIICLQIHPDIGIHVSGKTKMRKSQFQCFFRHLPGCIHSVAENCMRMKIPSEHDLTSPVCHLLCCCAIMKVSGSAFFITENVTDSSARSFYVRHDPLQRKMLQTA